MDSLRCARGDNGFTISWPEYPVYGALKATWTIYLFYESSTYRIVSCPGSRLGIAGTGATFSPMGNCSYEYINDMRKWQERNRQFTEALRNGEPSVQDLTRPCIPLMLC